MKRLAFVLIIGIAMFMMASRVVHAQAPICSSSILNTQYQTDDFSDGQLVITVNADQADVEGAGLRYREYITFNPAISVTVASFGLASSGVDPWRSSIVVGETEIWQISGTPPLSNVISVGTISLHTLNPGTVVLNCIDYSPPPETCSLVPNADFESPNTDWTLQGTAAITNSSLNLGYAGLAVQNITLNDNTTYEASIVVSNVISPPIDLNVKLNWDEKLVSVDATGTYTVSFDTGDLAGPVNYALWTQGLVSSKTIDIEFTCIGQAGVDSNETVQNECIAPPNGDFDTNADWDYFSGAAYNSALNAALLPMNNPETHSNPYYTPAFMTSSNSFTLPTITGTENLLLSFEAQSLQNQNGLLTTLLQNIGQTVEYQFLYEVYPQKYTFEADISNLAGQTTSILFGNDGGYPPAVIFPDDVSLDNVCIFLANRDPNLPAPVDPGAIDPIDAGAVIDCDDVTAFMIGWGLDMRYYREVYETTPSLWNPEDWVPWLISAFFVGLQISLCAFFAAIQSLLNMIEYFANSLLNYGRWIARNAELALIWIELWLGTIHGSLSNFVQALWTTVTDWADWVYLTVLEFAQTYNFLVFNLATLALSIIFGFLWLGSGLLALLFWLVPELANVAIGLINTLIEQGWNAFLIELGQVISNIINLLIGIWNHSLIPFLEFVALSLGGPLLALFNLFVLAWDLIFSIAMYFWVNVFQSINIPFAFYTGLSEGIQSTVFSDLLNCDGSTTNFWCNMFASLDLLNGVAGHTIFYPIVIVGIVLATIAILYRNVIALWNFFADWLTRI